MMKEAWDGFLFWKRKRAVVISTPTGLAVILISAHVISGETNGACHQKGWQDGRSLSLRYVSALQKGHPSLISDKPELSAGQQGAVLSSRLCRTLSLALGLAF
ncbi:hypothetical protein MPLB_1680093 [Mesorhizobium sp. ORS 3324]|nr:hypothetical protein MPLB_1680093 [Mesorhizobium sp. ORS 3324]